jgi:hypothetical protein
MSAAKLFQRALGLLVLGASLVASAYILPAGAILRHVADVRDELQLSLLRVDGSLILAGDAYNQASSALKATSANEVQADATLWLKVPGRCRLDVSTLDGGKLASVQNGAKKRFEGVEVTAISVALEHACAVLAARSGGDSRAALERYLASLKITERTTSLARFGGQVAYVIGNPAEGSPQFWIYKDRFLPARARIPDPSGEWDVRFLDYSSPATGDAFPRVLELRRGPQLLLRFTALKGDRHARVDDRLF